MVVGQDQDSKVSAYYWLMTWYLRDSHFIHEIQKEYQKFNSLFNDRIFEEYIILQRII